jgi:hypothetical protein
MVGSNLVVIWNVQRMIDSGQPIPAWFTVFAVLYAIATTAALVWMVFELCRHGQQK